MSGAPVGVKRRGWLKPPRWIQLLALGALLVTASELMLKKGASTTAVSDAAAGWFGIAALASWWTWGGIGCYVLSFLSWLHVLRYVPLSIAFPLINVVHVLVPLAALVFLHEPVSTRRWIGIALIVLGILAIMRPVAAAEAKL